MNYKAHYDKLISRAKDRRSPVQGYTERHHIVPRCLGGGEEPDNKVVLTAPEHFVAHLLLVRMHPGHKGLAMAAVGMASGASKNNPGRVGNKLYGWLRAEFAAAKFSPEAIKKMSISHKGRTCSPEHREKLRQVALNRSPEHKRRLALASKNAMSPEARARTTAANIGRKKSPEARAKMSLAARNRSPEHKAKFTAASIAFHTGAKRSIATRARMSLAAKNRAPETRAKYSAAMIASYARRRAAGG